MIRIGRTDKNRGKCDYPNFKTIIVTTKSRSGKYFSLSPYSVKDENGCIFENIWQFSKIYNTIPAVKLPYSKWDPTIIWEWPAETHMIDEKPTQAYWKWREDGMRCEYPIRYPVGFKHRTKCVCSYKNLKEDSVEGPMDYIEARKEIYLGLYGDLVKNVQEFKEIKEMLKKGQNILIVDVDGPVQSSMGYYKEKYSVNDKWIYKDSIEVTKKNMEILLNDEKHPFGHGFCLGLELLDIKI